MIQKKGTFDQKYGFSLAALAVLFLAAISTNAQDAGASAPNIVQPGAPGQPTRVLHPGTRASLPPLSLKDIEFMQGMIMHHAQAVEMTDLIEQRSQSRDVRLLGARISKSQTDEMQFMQRWLEARGQKTEMSSQKSGHGHGAQKAGGTMMMPGMLSPEQMNTLKEATGDEFDRLFLSGMIQHHEGALVMVKELFETAGSGQDAELFNFASDVDSGQRAEIATMKILLDRKTVEKKP